jgi:hypothetical protein
MGADIVRCSLDRCVNVREALVGQAPGMNDVTGYDRANLHSCASQAAQALTLVSIKNKL